MTNTDDEEGEPDDREELMTRRSDTLVVFWKTRSYECLEAESGCPTIRWYEHMRLIWTDDIETARLG